jgi:hypothetical protein
MVPEVIVVEEIFTQPKAKVRQASMVSVVTGADAPQPGYPIRLSVEAELVERGIRPPKHDLEDIVQGGNGTVTTDGQTLPEHRTDAQ